MAYVNLSKMPDAKKEYTLSFPALTGGLNVLELDYRLDNHESPKMQNLRWRDGVLSSRDGQVWKNSELNGEGHAAYQWLWYDRLFAHVNNTISCFTKEGEKTVLYTGPSDFTIRGTFFAYDGKLYYKTKGYYIVITAAETNNGMVFAARDVVDSLNKAYSPITYINCSPENGSGDIYQPENRLSAEKTLWYNAEHKVTIEASNAHLVPEIVQVTWLVKFPNSGTYAFVYNGSA